MKPISITPILKGLQAANQILAQPKGSVARISNLCYKKRGAMNTVDGSEIINWFNGSIQTTRGPFDAISLFQPINVARYFMTLNDSPDQQLPVPNGLAASLASGGSLTSGQEYFYVVTALDGLGGETMASSEVHATPSGGNLSVSLTWNAVPNAAAYNVYRGTTSGGEELLATSPVTATSYTDPGAPLVQSTYNLLASPSGAIESVTTFTHGGHTTSWIFVATVPITQSASLLAARGFTISGVTPTAFNGFYKNSAASVTVNGQFVTYVLPGIVGSNATGGGGTLGIGITPPAENTTQQMSLFKMPGVGTYPIAYSDSNTVALFPPAPIPIQGGEPAGSGGGGGITGGGIVGGNSPTPLGGIIGNTSTLPQLVQFNNQLFLALGNGFVPQVYTDIGSIPSNVTNVLKSTITTITENAAGTIATVATSAPHQLIPGSQFFIANNSDAAFNGGPFLALTASGTSITFALLTTGSSSGTGGSLTPTTIPLFNEFIPAFDAWLQESDYAINSLIVPANTPWSPNVAYSSQSAIVPDTPNGFYYVASKGGTSGSSEPSFPTTIGLTVSDGTVTWTCAGSSLYYYKATQGGISNGNGSTFTVPAFSQSVGGTVTDGSVIWANAGLLTSAAPVPPGAAHAIVYSGCLWVANTYPVDNPNGIDGPCSIRMSDVNAPNSWNPINQAFLDKDDGTQIQGMATFTISAQGIPPEGSLVVFKDFSTYQIEGIFGASNLSIQRVVTDMGCTAPRSIQFVPGFGIVRMTHLGIAKFDGVRDELISEEIRPFLFPSNDNDIADITPMDQNYSYGSYGFQTANPPMYCLAIPIGSSGGQLTRILCYDLVTKEWGIVDLPFAIGSAAQVRAEGTIPIAMLGGFLDGVLQRWQAGDIQWYTGAGSPSQSNVNWSFRTQEMASQVGDQRMYYRRLAIRGYNTNSTAGVTVTPFVNGTQGNTYVSPPIPFGDFEIFAPIAMTGVRCHCNVSGSGDVEIQALSYHTEIKPAGVPVVIS